MTVPNIDTFEHDIREEIKNREASVGDIASASGVIKNNPEDSKTSKEKILIITFSLMGVIIFTGFSYLAYVYMVSKPTTKQESAQIINNQIANQNTEKIISDKLNKISPTLSSGISHFTTRVEQNPYGIIIELNDYSPVFAFMIKNENQIAKDILSEDISKNTNATNTPNIKFSDETKSNQNMRVLTVGSSTLVYAFLNEKYLAVANSVENILQLRGAIIK